MGRSFTAVFGVPNPDFGEEVKAIVPPRDMAQAGPALAQELLAFCQQHLAKMKCPRSIGFEKELPGPRKESSSSGFSRNATRTPNKKT